MDRGYEQRSLAKKPLRRKLQSLRVVELKYRLFFLVVNIAKRQDE